MADKGNNKERAPKVDGAPDKNLFESYYQDYAHPPAITLTP